MPTIELKIKKKLETHIIVRHLLPDHHLNLLLLLLLHHLQAVFSESHPTFSSSTRRSADIWNHFSESRRARGRLHHQGSGKDILSRVFARVIFRSLAWQSLFFDAEKYLLKWVCPSIPPLRHFIILSAVSTCFSAPRGQPCLLFIHAPVLALVGDKLLLVLVELKLTG